jgi:hypothetical protein
MDLTSKVTASGNSTPLEQKWSPSPPTVGQTDIVYSVNAFTGRDHVVVVANFTDGTMQVVLDTYT